MEEATTSTSLPSDLLGRMRLVTRSGRGRLGRPILVLVCCVLLAPVVAGCRSVGPFAQGGQTETPEVSQGAYGVLSDSVLWIWPPCPQKPEEFTGGTVYFRLAKPYGADDLRIEVTPPAPAQVHHLGCMVAVALEQLDAEEHGVALVDVASGAVLARTRVGRPVYPPPLATLDVSECWMVIASPDATGGHGWVETTVNPKDGDTVHASFGEVVVTLQLRGTVPESSFWQAFSTDPPAGQPDYGTMEVAGQAVTYFQLRWPEVPVIKGQAPPDPSTVTGAPEGFTLQMKLTIDASKLPTSAGMGPLAGNDGLFEVTVLREKVAEVSVACRDEARGSVVAAHNGLVDYWMTPEPHTFEVTFTKAMDRGSVERAIIWDSLYDNNQVRWDFAWATDRALQAIVSPADPHNPPALRVTKLDLAHARDAQGIGLWFPSPLLLGWAGANEVARVDLGTLFGQGPETMQPSTGAVAAATQVVLDPAATPTGAGVVQVTEVKPGGTVLGLLLGEGVYYEYEEIGEGTVPSYAVWVGSGGSTWNWVVLRPEIDAESAEFMPGGGVFVNRWNGWTTLGDPFADGGPSAGTVEVGCGALPSKRLSADATKVAVLGVEGFGEPVLRVSAWIYDLAGKELAEVPEATKFSTQKDYDELRADGWRLPAAWLPDGSGLLMAGADGIIVLGLEGDGSPTTSTLPDSQGIDCMLGDSLVCLSQGSGGARAYACGLFTASGGGSELRVLTLPAGEKVLSGDPGLDHARFLLASPDGRFLAVSNGRETKVFDLGDLTKPRSAGSGFTELRSVTVTGKPCGWSLDGQRLYLERWGQWPGGE